MLQIQSYNATLADSAIKDFVLWQRNQDGCGLGAGGEWGTCAGPQPSLLTFSASWDFVVLMPETHIIGFSATAERRKPSCQAVAQPAPPAGVSRHRLGPTAPKGCRSPAVTSPRGTARLAVRPCPGRPGKGRRGPGAAPVTYRRAGSGAGAGAGASPAQARRRAAPQLSRRGTGGEGGGGGGAAPGRWYPDRGGGASAATAGRAAGAALALWRRALCLVVPCRVALAAPERADPRPGRDWGLQLWVRVVRSCGNPAARCLLLLLQTMLEYEYLHCFSRDLKLQNREEPPPSCQEEEQSWRKSLVAILAIQGPKADFTNVRYRLPKVMEELGFNRVREVLLLRPIWDIIFTGDGHKTLLFPLWNYFWICLLFLALNGRRFITDNPPCLFVFPKASGGCPYTSCWNLKA